MADSEIKDLTELTTPISTDLMEIQRVSLGAAGSKKVQLTNLFSQLAQVTSVFGRTGAIVAASNDYTWAQINKTTSSLADITTRSAADLNSGILPLARLSGITTTELSATAGITNAQLANSSLTVNGTANRLTGGGAVALGAALTLNVDTSLLPSPVLGDANKFLRASGANASLWDTLAASDIPSLDVSKLTSGILGSARGGTGNGFAKFSGPTATEKTFTLPDASATVLTDNALVTVAQGGTGAPTLTGLVKGNGTSAFSAAGAGTDYVAPGLVTASGLTQNTARLLGRTTASAGAVEEISIGSGLSMSGAVLSASGSSGANTALSNLASVSVNASLIPQTTLDLGAAATPWRNVYIYGSGTFGSHSIKLTGAPAGNRTVTLPDADTKLLISSQHLTFSGPTAARTLTIDDAAQTLARRDAGQTFTGIQVFTSPNIVTSVNDTNSNELMKLTATTSAVNEITLANAATGGKPSFTATGDDTNIGLRIVGQGNGEVHIGNGTSKTGNSGAAASIRSNTSNTSLEAVFDVYKNNGAGTGVVIQVGGTSAAVFCNWLTSGADMDLILGGITSAGAYKSTLTLTSAGNASVNGNALIGTTTVPSANAGKVLVFGDNGATAPTLGASTTALYQRSGEQYVKDAAGNETLLSPHNFRRIPGGRSEDMAWSVYSERDGRFITVDMTRMIRLVEKLSGETLIYTGKARN